jgi:hypothetical protein
MWLFFKNKIEYNILEDLKNPNSEEKFDCILKSNIQIKKKALSFLIILITFLFLLISISIFTTKISTFQIIIFSITIFLIISLIILRILIELEEKNEIKIRKNFIEICREILIAEDILKLLIKNQLYKIENFKYDYITINKIFINFLKNSQKNFGIFLHEKDLEIEGLIINETLNEDNENLNQLKENFFDTNKNFIFTKLNFFQCYLQKKKILFEAIFCIYEKNKDNKYFFNFYLLKNLQKYSQNLEALKNQINSFNIYMRNSIKEFFNGNLNKEKNFKENFEDLFYEVNNLNNLYKDSKDNNNNHNNYNDNENIFEDLLDLFSKITESLKNENILNENYFSNIGNFTNDISDVIINKEKNNINFNSNKFLSEIKKFEENFELLIEKKTQGLLNLKKIRNFINEKFSEKNDEENLDEKNLLEKLNEKDNYFDNIFTGNDFDFINFPLNLNKNNDIENERIHKEKMQEYTVSLFDIYKGEQDNKHLKMNLLSELQEIQEMRINENEDNDNKIIDDRN